MNVGIKGEQKVRVDDTNTAAALGSGLLKVFSTPSALALIEKTCWMSVAPFLEEGQGTVGTRVELDHVAT
ncbi:MAG: dihydrolipoamide acyltransferase, partial [Paludibacteraceae bacterium]|nr:dihydrolipoamide acyltransferase [Paludibacteraceae bacterium]